MKPVLVRLVPFGELEPSFFRLELTLGRPIDGIKIWCRVVRIDRPEWRKELRIHIRRGAAHLLELAETQAASRRQLLEVFR